MIVGANCNRIDDDDKLREKVDEALTVYDEYVKNKGGDAAGQTDGEAKSGEPAADGGSEENKA